MVAVRRDEDLMVPRGDLVLQAGDRVAVLAATTEADGIRAFLSRVAEHAAGEEQEAADTISDPS